MAAAAKQAQSQTLLFALEKVVTAMTQDGHSGMVVKKGKGKFRFFPLPQVGPRFSATATFPPHPP
jgi:hypothetical protein